LRWTWDTKKATQNLKKHKVSFKLAEYALDDPFAMTYPNPYPSETRWTTLCSPSPDGRMVLYVVHTWPNDEGEPGRIISARQATSRERLAYEER
jgi:uncharacterized protein